MSIRVSVVVAVYNTGQYIEPLLKSLVGQSMPADEFEMIFVDDGSDDGVTPARLDEFARDRANVVVRHIFNSGWPGKPRNIGIDLARGDYVFFADHDDWFAPEALARLVAYADQNSSDIVIGKYAGHRRGVAKQLFTESKPDATLANATLMDSLTPHKLFRLDFLDKIGLRFPEGKRRLEDHVFVVEAYFRASTISVYADYHVYFHIGRTDEGNAGYQRIDPPFYYRFVRETIDIVLAHTEPGEFRNRLLRRPMRQEVLARLDGLKFAAQDRDYQRLLFDSARGVAVDMVPSEVDDRLSVRQRIAGELLRDDRFDDLLTYNEMQAAVRCSAELTRLRWTDEGTLDVAFSASLTLDGEPLRYDRAGDEWFAPVPLERGVRDDTRRATRDIPRVKVRLVARRRSDSKEFVLATKQTIVPHDEIDATDPIDGADGRTRSWLQLDGEAVVDHRRFGRDQHSFWDFYVKVNQTGWAKEARLGRNRAPGVDVSLALVNGTTVLPYWTNPTSDLTVRVGVDTRTFARALHPSRVSASGGAVAVSLPLRVFGDAPRATLRLAPAGPGSAVDLAAAVSAGTLRADRRWLAPGVWRVRYSLGLAGWGRPRTTGWVLLSLGVGPVVVTRDRGPALARRRADVRRLLGRLRSRADLIKTRFRSS